MRSLLTAAMLLALAGPNTALAGFHQRIFEVDCDQGETVSRALAIARAGDTIRVEGTCEEALTIAKSVTLDGGGATHIASPRPSDSAITVIARDVIVRGFRLEAPAVFQVFVTAAASLTLDSNTIRNAANFGVSAGSNSQVTLVGNTITDNGLGGVIGLTGVNLNIGMGLVFEPPSPNVIADNAQYGVVLISNASASILGGNTISGQNIGVIVLDGAQARIAGNIIDGNGFGIFLDAGGVVQLPQVANAVPAFTELNSGVNARYGIACKGGAIRGVPDGLAPAVRLPPTPGVLTGPADGLATHCLDQTESLPSGGAAP